MHAWIDQTLAAQTFGPAGFAAVFLLGLLGAVTSCCALPVIGAVAGYAGTLGAQQSRRELFLVGASFMLGTILALAALGALMGGVGHLAGAALGGYWKFAAGLLVIFFGLAGLGLVPFRLPQIDLGLRAGRQGLAGPIVYGLAVGGAATACSAGCNPLLAVVAGAAVLKGATVMGAAIFAVFALGYSLPLAAGLVGIGLGLGRLGTVARGALTAVRIGAGVLLIAVGFYLLATIS